MCAKRQRSNDVGCLLLQITGTKDWTEKRFALSREKKEKRKVRKGTRGGGGGGGGKKKRKKE